MGKLLKANRSKGRENWLSLPANKTWVVVMNKIRKGKDSHQYGNTNAEEIFG